MLTVVSNSCESLFVNYPRIYPWRWSSRMGEHPKTTTRVATLLKSQSGKCTHCGMYFREEDVLEIDHITPKSLGGKDEYKNLQILHRHCHDEKTTEDGSVVKYT
jgi:RNA-directed DNA polymerase